MRSVSLFVVLALLSLGPASAGIDARMLRHPDVSAHQIAFTYAGDIWLAPASGGLAQRLSTPKGEELFARFAPDGLSLAYSANYDGNTDIYVVSVTGGAPRRITHHPGVDRVIGWYPDGKSLLFASQRTSGSDRFNKFFKVAATGGLPEELPLPYAEFGAIAPDGKTLAYTPISLDFRTWKRYRGGMAPDIWLFDLTTHVSRNLTSHPANDSQPMWRGRTLYFLSDRDEHQRLNIWACDLDRGALRQVTAFADFDVRFPSIGPNAIVFEQGGRLHLLDLATERVAKVEIEVVTDQATLKRRTVNAASLIRGAGLSPSGKRAVLAARGEVFSLPAEHGPALDLTRTSGAAERYPAWSPDGKSVAYFSDRTGEYELTVRPADGAGEERTVTELGPGYRYNIFWSPDSKSVVFIDQAMKINLCTLETGKVMVLDQGLDLYQGELEGFAASWSADSRWIAYSRNVANLQAAVFLYDTKSGQRHQVTTGFYATMLPTFDPEGKQLYVLTNRTFKPLYSDLDNTWIYANTTGVAAIPLRKDTPSPLAPRDDREGGDGEVEQGKTESGKDGKAKSEQAKQGQGQDAKAEDAKPKPVEIDLAGFEERLVMLPAAPGNYAQLAAVAGKVLYRRLPRAGASEDEKSAIVYYDLEERKEQTVVNDADFFALSADGKKLLVRRKDVYAIVDVKPDQNLSKTIATGELAMELDPPAEWRQIFNDAWRIERDFFYDPGMHGVDWKAMRERYGALLEQAVTRWDVNFVIGELIAELNASHTYRGGGDAEQPLERGVGLLGADFALEQGAYRIKRIVGGAPWDSEARSPLRQPGVNVQEGDYLLAVNRAPLSSAADPWAAFQGLSGKTVILTVNSKPTLAGAREVLVEMLADEGRLRRLSWIEEKRRKVEEATDGQCGYVYVSDTSIEGQTELVRQFRAQIDKPGLIIDERFNSGGQIPDRFIELLNRPVTNYWGVRDGVDWQWPPIAHDGPKVMLINGWSGSGGDAFPFYFKQAGLGLLIGQRTWGGLIGITGAPGLVDGGVVTAPTFGIYNTKGQWIIEGHGVDPDIEVVADPSQMARGGDPQLERAIEEIKRKLAERPPRRPAKPQYPNRSGR